MPRPVPVEHLTALENLTRDGELLARGRRAARCAELTDTSLSLGVSQAPGVRSATRARAAGLEVVRRSTGGTGVLAGPGDVAWTRVFPVEDPEVGRDFAGAYGRLGRPIVEALGDLGLEARWEPGPALVPEFCLLSGRGQVLRTPAGILGGAAQHRTGRALLHHGILHRRVDPRLWERVFDLPAGGSSAVAGFEDGPRPRGPGARVSVAIARRLGESEV